ncbi:MAG TPA: hypothetical protein VEK06_04730, partial [Myxococcota bacterium]|nr:hypothetical protein [Myxococcota bacterium]
MRLTFYYSVLLLVMSSCTSPNKERIPGVQVMHYPFSMAIKDQFLFLSSQSSDRKYSFGRLVAINLNSVESALSKANNKGPLPYGDVVTANTLIPCDVGLLGI